jgi:hypothetical protein
MSRILLSALLALLCSLAAGCAGSEGAPAAKPPPAVEKRAMCAPARVHYRPYPGGDERLSELPWVAGKPAASGLVGLLWYWPEDWRRQRVSDARIYTGGVAPQGRSVKILWAFVAPSAKGRGGSELLVEGNRLDGPGGFEARFAAISYAGAEGAPSYASIVEIPRPGCWRLRLSTGDLRAEVDVRAENA